ncbi:MAG: hypothetical protein GDA46_04675 [Bdellovibrionales bacterium]|nr:hypothetical protein [Bdellovibrionales bacterium]
MASYSYATSPCEIIYLSKVNTNSQTFNKLQKLVQELQQNDDFNFKKFQQIEESFFMLKNSVNISKSIIFTFIKDLFEQDQDFLRIRVGLIGLRYFNNKELLKQIEIQNFLSHEDPRIIQETLKLIFLFNLEIFELRDKLIKLLSHKDSKVIEEALRIITYFKLEHPAKLNKALIKLLSHKDSDVIQITLRVIGYFKKTKLLGLSQALMTLLSHKDAIIIQEALKIIVYFSTFPYKNRFIYIIFHGNIVIQLVTEDMKKIPSVKTLTPKNNREFIKDSVLLKNQIIKLLSHSDSYVILEVLMAIIDLNLQNQPELNKSLIKLLSHKDSEVREKASRVIKKLEL